jgi:hypothetical protein
MKPILAAASQAPRSADAHVPGVFVDPTSADAAVVHGAAGEKAGDVSVRPGIVSGSDLVVASAPADAAVVHGEAGDVSVRPGISSGSDLFAPPAALPSGAPAVPDNAPALRLVHSVRSLPPVEQPSDSQAHHAEALHAVPQYVASPAGDPHTHRAVGSDAFGDMHDIRPAHLSQSGEDDMVSAQQMARALQLAAGDDMPVVSAGLSAPAGAHERAGQRWFGGAGAPPALHHVNMAAQWGVGNGGPLGRLGPEPTHGPVPSAAATTPLSERGSDGAGFPSDVLGDPGTLSFSVGEDWGGSHDHSGFLSGSVARRDSGDSGGRVPLDQTPEWAALLDMLADRGKMYALFDQPAFLDELADRLHDRILSRIRRELVVERERHGLLAPRS